MLIPRVGYCNASDLSEEGFDGHHSRHYDDLVSDFLVLLFSLGCALHGDFDNHGGLVDSRCWGGHASGLQALLTSLTLTLLGRCLVLDKLVEEEAGWSRSRHLD